MFKLTGIGLRRLVLVGGIAALVVLSDPSAKTNKRAGLLAIYGADAVMIDRNARGFKMPDQIDWRGRPGSPNQSATSQRLSTSVNMAQTELSSL